MDFKSLKDRVQDLSGSASDAVSKMLDDFNAALPTMRALGYYRMIRHLQVHRYFPFVGLTYRFSLNIT